MSNGHWSPGVLVFRPDGSLLYVNADNVLATVFARLAFEPPGSVRLVVCGLSAASHLDLAAVGMLRKLHATLEGQRIRLAVSGSHGEVRDLLRRRASRTWSGGSAHRDARGRPRRRSSRPRWDAGWHQRAARAPARRSFHRAIMLIGRCATMASPHAGRRLGDGETQAAEARGS